MTTRAERRQAVVFDLDGTLLDTAPEFVSSVQQLRAEQGLAAMDPGLIRQHVSDGARALVTLALALAPTDPDFEPQRLRLLALYQAQLGSATSPYPGIVELLATLSAQRIGWGICTNKPAWLTGPLLQRLQLRPAPRSVVCADQVSRPKPHPEPLLLNASQLGCQPHNMVYIGDHRRDVEAGRAAGMFTIAATYGYLRAGDDPARWNAHALAGSSRELAGLIAAALLAPA